MHTSLLVYSGFVYCAMLYKVGIVFGCVCVCVFMRKLEKC